MEATCNLYHEYCIKRARAVYSATYSCLYARLLWHVLVSTASLLVVCSVLVLFPDSTMHVKKGSGDIGTDSWFCKLSNHVIRFVLEHVWSHEVRKTKKCFNVPRPFSSLG